MRIGTYGMINQIYGSNKTKKSNTANSTGFANFKDEVSFSSAGKDMQVAKNALAGVPDVRETKIRDVKSKIDNGTYEVSSADFAKKLLENYAAKQA